MGIRKRFLIFSAAWLVFCTILVTVYLIPQTRLTLLELSVQHAGNIAAGLAKEATVYLHVGDERALAGLLNEVQKQPDVMAARVEQGGRTWGRQVARIDVLDTVPSQRPGATGIGEPRLVRADGRRAIEAREPIWLPIAADLLSDHPPETGSVQRPPDGYAVVTVSIERIFQKMDVLAARSMVLWILVLGIGLAVGWWLSGKMVSPLQRLAHRARSLTDADRDAPSPTRLFTGDDEIRSLWASLTAMKRELDRKTGEIVRLQGSVEDTVRQHTADLEEINRRLSEILALKNDLLLQVSHEVRTPLTALSALISNLRDGVVGAPTARQREYYERAMGITNHVRRLLTTLLEFAMAETGKIHLSLRPIEVAGTAREALNALQPLQEDKDVSCVIADSMFGKWAVADPDRVQQILLNLIHNAIKASPPHAFVVIDAQAEGGEIIVSVKNSGPGIRPADRATLLRQPVPSGSQPPGSGVGLCICRYLVELHGGRIWFESEEGQGATFFFSLPSARVPAAIAPPGE
jgi:signal transduction histidine kinase